MCLDWLTVGKERKPHLTSQSADRQICSFECPHKPAAFWKYWLWIHFSFFHFLSREVFLLRTFFVFIFSSLFVRNIAYRMIEFCYVCPLSLVCNHSFQRNISWVAKGTLVKYQRVILALVSLWIPILIRSVWLAALLLLAERITCFILVSYCSPHGTLP